jgi:hypothetical protein
MSPIRATPVGEKNITIPFCIVGMQPMLLRNIYYLGPCILSNESNKSNSSWGEASKLICRPNSKGSLTVDHTTKGWYAIYIAIFDKGK